MCTMWRETYLFLWELGLIKWTKLDVILAEGITVLIGMYFETFIICIDLVLLNIYEFV